MGSQASGTEARRVLVVEDNEDARDMMVALLEAWGHRVFSAADGSEGVASACLENPDVALIDLGLPDIDGFEVARRIRRQIPEPRPTLVALSGYSSLDDLEGTREAGFDMHWVKPIEPHRLAALLLDLKTRG